MIFLPGEFAWWLPLICSVWGVTTALIIGSIVAGGLAAAGGTAHLVKTLAEGNLPWDDPAAFLLGQLRAGAGGLGEVIKDASGQDTLQQQIKQVERSGNQGTGMVMPGSTGQGLAQLSSEIKGQNPIQQMQGGGSSPGGALAGLQGGMNQWNAPVDTPSRGDLMKGAAKDFGKGLAMQVAGVGLGGLGGAIFGPATQAAQAATSAAAPAAGGAVGAAVPSVAGVGPGVSGGAVPGLTSATPSIPAGALPTAATPAPQSAIQTALDTVKSVPSAIGNVARGIGQYSILPMRSALTEAIGAGPTSILGQAGVGAITGAGGAAIEGQNPLRGALSGAAGGLVGGVAGLGAQSLQPGMEPTFVPTPRQPLSLLGGATQPNAFQMAMQQGPQTIPGALSRPAPSMLGGLTSSIVNQAMTPTPGMPPPPPYQHRSTYADILDLAQSPYASRAPYYGRY